MGYEDPKLLMEFACTLDRSTRVPRYDIEMSICNRGGYPIQHVQLISRDPEYIHACELRLQPLPTGAEPGMLWPHEKLKWRGQLKIFAPFETGPQVEFSYLLPDSMICR